MNPNARSTEQKLRLAIQKELRACDGRAYPTICRSIGTPEGYRRIEEMVIRTVINQSLSVAAAVALVESELG